MKIDNVSTDKLFDRPPEASYLEEWSKLLAQPQEKFEETKETSMVVFRLSNEWFALSALVFSEIGNERIINTIPCHCDDIILGVVNLRGQLRLCVSMLKLLELEKPFIEALIKPLSVIIHVYWPLTMKVICGLFPQRKSKEFISSIFPKCQMYPLMFCTCMKIFYRV